jgi:hypothetical protein
MLRLSLVLATIALVGFAGSTLAQAAEQFALTGTVDTVEILYQDSETLVVRITVYGEGTIGPYSQVTIATFVGVGGTTSLFEDSTRIDILDEDGESTGDVIYMEGFGTSHSGIGAQGSYEIAGGEGIYEDASGNGSFFYRSPTARYTGVIRY